MVHPIRYPEILPPEDRSYHPKAVGRTMFMTTVDRGAAETIIDYLQHSDASRRVAQLRVLGGAMARVSSDATAFAHRQSRILVNVAAFYNGDDDRSVREAWTKEFAAVLHQEDFGAYVAFVADEGEARVRPGPLRRRDLKLRGAARAARETSTHRVRESILTG